MDHYYADIEVCVDCLCMLANGVESEEQVETSKLIEARWPWPTWQLTINCPEVCDGSFSWQPCEACGSNLGGDRHPVVVWKCG